MGKKIVMPKLNKISSRTLEAIRKETSKYIYVKDKDGNAFCERCNEEFVLSKTKHLQNYKCPHCSKKMKIVHKWRRKYEWRTDWRVIVSVINENVMVYRYIIVDRSNEKINELKEVARAVTDFESLKTHEWELWANEWKRTGRHYFKEFYMYHYRTHECCLQADPHNLKLFINELRKMPRYKYVDFAAFDEFIPHWYIASLFNRIALKSLMIEQLQKAGYNDLVVQDFKYTSSYQYKCLEYDNTKKSLAKKLGLSEQNFKRLKDNQTLEAYKILKENPIISDEDLELISYFGYENYKDINYTCKILQLKRGKTIQYLKKQVIPDNFKVSDYIDYLKLLDKLNYPIDTQYAYPKNFREFKAELVERWNKELERRRNMTPKEVALEEARKDKKMYLISKALRESKELKKWFEGADGLKVFVPESVGELVDSGIKLHNCLGNYADRITSNISILFFIRRIDEPDKEYIAMEYRYGKVNQLRLDNNIEVTDCKIINFADALARKLNEINACENIIANVIKEVA